MPAHNTIQQTYSQETSIGSLIAVVTSALTSIDGVSSRPLDPRSIHSPPPEPCLDILVSATTDLWSRVARRRQAREANMEVDPASTPALVCRVLCAAYTRGAVLQCDWVKGRDRKLFESFASHLSRKVAGTLSSLRT